VKTKTQTDITTLVKANILDPLKMNNTYYDSPSIKLNEAAVGYAKKWSFMALIYKLVGKGRTNKLLKTDKHLVIQPLYAPHNGYIGLKSTARDLSKLLKCVSSSSCNIPDSTLRSKMLNEQFSITEGKAIGLGWHIRQDFLGVFYRHIGGGPGFGCEVRVYENGFYVVVLGNSTFRPWDYANLIAYNHHLYE